jgi:hypothetical protein
MNDRNLEDARRLFEQAKPAPTISEYDIEQKAHQKNRERLKSERLVREAAAQN